MRRFGPGRWLLLTVSMVSVWATVGVGLGAGSSGEGRLRVRPEVEAQLQSTPAAESTKVLVTGDTTYGALSAVHAAGLTTIEVFERFRLVAASGRPAEVRALHLQPGIRRVDANPRLEWLDDRSHRSTGIDQLRDAQNFPELADLRRADGSAYNGTGVSIAVVDSGFDATHEQFLSKGDTKFDVHLRQGCPVFGEIVEYGAGVNPSPYCSAWIPMTTVPDPDYTSGHGTIVAATAAGYRRTTPSGVRVSGAATGARLVGLSTGAGPAIYNGFSALNWVLKHHRNPCGDGSCPAIRVVNNSWGLAADDGVFVRRFDPESPISRVTTALVEEGVVVIFAAANDGGDGSMAMTNFVGLNPIPGFLMVGAYHDANAGDQDMLAWNSSSRGKEGDRGTYPDLLAPGAHLTIGRAMPTYYGLQSLGPGDDGPYGTFSGTSLAAPYVAGVVAQMFEADPTLTPAEIEDVLEDTAHQLGRAVDLEPDIYKDYAGRVRGNDDHSTSFDAGHGNVDVVRALAEVLLRSSRSAPDMCPRSSSVSIIDPPGDTRLVTLPSGPLNLAGHDVVGVEASLDAVPGALSVVVTYRDLPAVALVPMHATLEVAVDRGGELGSEIAEIDFDRAPAGDSFSVFTGDVRVEGTVDPDADTVAYLIRPTKGPLRVRATVMWIWTALSNLVNGYTTDDVEGRCTLWRSPH